MVLKKNPNKAQGAEVPPWEEVEERATRARVPAERANGGAVARPMVDESDASFGELRSDSFEVPIFKLIHPVSPEIQSQREARPGEFWHSALAVNLGPKVRVTLLRQTPYLGLLDPQNGKLLARATMEGEWETPHAEFNVVVNSKPTLWKLKGSVRESGLGVMGSSGGYWSAATPSFDCIFWLHEEDINMPCLMRFKKTAARPLKELLTIIEMRRAAGVPRYQQMYDLRAKLVSGPSTQYHVPYFQDGGKITDRALFDRLTAVGKILAQTEIKVVGDTEDQSAAPKGPRTYGQQTEDI